jgi:uncharacterized membrane protein
MPPIAAHIDRRSQVRNKGRGEQTTFQVNQMFFTNSFQAINTLDNAIESANITLKYSRKAILGLIWGVTFAAAFAWYFGKALGKAYYANNGPSVEVIAKAVWRGAVKVWQSVPVVVRWIVATYDRASIDARQLINIWRLPNV